MNYQDRLLRIALRFPECTGQTAETVPGERVSLDSKTRALARLAALIATGGPVASYSELVDAAVDEGATPTDTVEVLVAIVDIVGSPRTADAAPKLAMALGFDIDTAMEANDEHRPGLSPQ